ncbi:hypothetical protein GJ496_006593 [Pomphorhynchus laevis]|nr:hypothetical protein GJ496_006593 [Pomphorhynchus laevis]
MPIWDIIKSQFYVKAIPITISTWEFPEAASAAADVLREDGSAVDAVIAGCYVCEEANRASVGTGGNFDENGEVTQDAMIMDGSTFNVGAVAGLRRIAHGIKAAEAVLNHTQHSLLVGDLATQFAKDMGIEENDSLPLKNEIKNDWLQWIKDKCQPNYRKNVSPNPKESCGPYFSDLQNMHSKIIDQKEKVDSNNHDTVGILALDANGNIAAACSTNGMRHKVPGRVGDSPIVGSGAYADSLIGAAAATGDGDQMMKMCPSFDVVRRMESGVDPALAAEHTLLQMSYKLRLKKQKFKGAIIALNKKGKIGAACIGYDRFRFCVNTTDKQKIYEIKCADI